MKTENLRGWVCRGPEGRLGLVLSAGPVRVSGGMAHTGISLTGDVGGPWASATPEPLADVSDQVVYFLNTIYTKASQTRGAA